MSTLQPDANAAAELQASLTTEADTERLGQAIAAVAHPGLVIGLVGPLGAGKTRLVRAIAEALGVDPAAIASPTFVLVHEYDARLPIRHFDVYRLKSPAEFEDLAVAEDLEADGLCLVEWADRVASLLPMGAWMIRLESTGPGSRRASITLPPVQSQALQASLQAHGLHAD